MKHFSINNVHKSLGFANSRRFLRNNPFFYTILSGIVFPMRCQAEGKNSCLGYESHSTQSPALNSVDLGILDIYIYIYYIYVYILYIYIYLYLYIYITINAVAAGVPWWHCISEFFRTKIIKAITTSMFYDKILLLVSFFLIFF